jgi:predicted Ser/Thr protein kinase
MNAMEAPNVTWMLLLGALCVVVPILAGIVALGVVLANRRRETLDRSDTDWGQRRPSARPIGRVRRTAPAFCPECGAGLPEDAPEGLCPKCLLKGVISSAHEAAHSAADGATAAYSGTASPSVEELAPLFPQFEILELIGQGGMGSVYKARQSSLDRLVAIKVLPSDAGKDPTFAERFNREARVLARLSHPNIVAIHDVGKAGDLFYFVMEYVDGVNLRQVMRDGQLRPEQALQIVPQICDALQYAHEEGVVHRDIKPENILLDRKGRVKIADFGLAKLLGRDKGNFTLTGSQQIMGTLYYMAPEQVERPLEVDHRADIYSLGVVFYEMLTGQVPVGRFAMPSEKAGTDAYLDKVVLHALEREPERRYQHVSDVKTDVESGARQAPRPLRHAVVDDLELARHQVQGPARGLIVVGLLGPLGWFVAFLLFALYIYIQAPSQWFWSEMAKAYFPFLAFFLGNAVVGGFLVAGGLKMRRLEAYEFSVLSCVMVLLQLATPTWPINLLIGLWAFWVLRKPEVKAAFDAELQRRTRTAAEREQSPDEAARTRVRAPAFALMAAGILYTLPLVVLMLVAAFEFFVVESMHSVRALQAILVPLLPSFLAGMLMVLGAENMLRLRSYNLAVTGTVLALLPCSPCWIVGLPIGILALAVLNAPEVKAAFGRSEITPESRGSARRPG